MSACLIGNTDYLLAARLFAPAQQSQKDRQNPSAIALPTPEHFNSGDGMLAFRARKFLCFAIKIIQPVLAILKIRQHLMLEKPASQVAQFRHRFVMRPATARHCHRPNCPKFL